MTKEALLILFGDQLEELTLYALKRIGNVEDARDMVGEVALALMSRSEDAGEIRCPMAYFKTSLRHLTFDMHKKSANTVSLDDKGESCIAKTYEQEFERETGLSELLTWLDQQLTSCPPEIAEAFRLRYLDGYPLKEVAKIVGIPANTLAQRFRRLRKQIRKSYPEMWATFVLIFKCV